jgi:hypothetical protein
MHNQPKTLKGQNGCKGKAILPTWNRYVNFQLQFHYKFTNVFYFLYVVV